MAVEEGFRVEISDVVAEQVQQKVLLERLLALLPKTLEQMEASSMSNWPIGIDAK